MGVRLCDGYVVGSLVKHKTKAMKACLLSLRAYVRPALARSSTSTLFCCILCGGAEKKIEHTKKRKKIDYFFTRKLPALQV